VEGNGREKVKLVINLYCVFTNLNACAQQELQSTHRCCSVSKAPLINAISNSFPFSIAASSTDLPAMVGAVSAAEAWGAD
jgi:hypothetical protein